MHTTNSLIDALGIGIIIIDGDHRIISANQWVYDHLNKRSFKAGQSFWDLFPEAKNTSIEKTIQSAFQKGSSTFLSDRLNNNVLALYRNQFSEIPLKVKILVSPFNITNENCTCLIQIIDTTQVHQRERFLIEQNKKIEEERIRTTHSARLASIGEMAGGIAHEINNPLTILKGSTMLLKKLLESESFTREKAHKKIDIVEKTVERLAKIVDGIRSISRSPEGQNFVETSLYEIINDVLSIFGEKFNTHGVKLIIDDKAPEFHENIRVLKILFYQVFINLLNNAYDAIIQDEADKWISICAKSEDDQLVILVTDSGKGIDKNIAENIFVPFYTTKDVQKGTGLGLSTVYKIIAAHKGTVHLNPDSPNTQFVITIPKNRDD